MEGQVKRGRGRPRKEVAAVVAEQVVVRPKRTPVSGSRDVLAVQLRKDVRSRFSPRWVKDVDVNGSRVLRFLNAGYTFVRAEEVDSVGAESVQKASDVGNVIRVPAGKEYTASGAPMYLYLMKIPKEFYEEDQSAKQQKISELEDQISDDFYETSGKRGYGGLKRE